MAWTPDQFRLTGGINEEDPAFVLPPGFLTFCRNYECLAGGGYRRIEGYERFDGRVAWPSIASYSVLPYDQGGPRPIVEGDLVTGGTSGATAHVVGTTELSSGTWSGLDAAGNIGITKITGAFVSGETLLINSVVSAHTTAVATPYSIGDASYKSWLGGAREYYRSLIAAPTGTGSILGGFVLAGVVYCFRESAGSVKLYKSTTSGWSAVTLSSYLRFDTGTAEINEGDTITGGTSAATAVVKRVNIGAGNYAGPTFASGRFAVDTIVGTFQNAEDLKVGGVTKAKAVGTTAASSFATGGRFQTLVTNFYGASNLRRAYGIDGVNRAWEFDGTIFCFIETGMTVDTPMFMEAHRNHLFLAFPGGSVQNSGTGLPLTWSPRTGASEIGIGDDPTGMKSNGNNTLAITAAKTVQILTGTSDLDWNLRSISDEIGSVAYSLAEAGGQTLFLDRSAVNVLVPAPPTFQDYSTQAISRNVRKTIERMAPNAVDSLHAVKKNQYRLFFDDKTALIGTFYGSKLMGWAAALYKHQFTCSWNGTDADGVERMYAGTDDGYVMMLDSGTSFDGEAIESILQLPYSYHKSPDRDKAFHKITLEMDTPRAVDIRIVTDFDYGGGGQSGQFLQRTNPTGGLWDVSLWDQFFWDSAVLSRPETNIDGVGINIGITLYHNDAVDEAFSISACLLQFNLLGIRR